MKYELYSFRNGKVIFENDERYTNDWNELISVIENITEEEVIDLFNSSIRTSIKSLSEPINKIIDNRLTEKGWQRQCAIFNDSEYLPYSENHSHPRTIDFSKNEIGLEVAFNNGQVVAWNLLKLVLAGELNHVEKDINTSVGVIISATDELKQNGGFDGAIGSYEKYLQYLKPMRNHLTIPMIIIGLRGFTNYNVVERKVYKISELLSKDYGEKTTQIQEYFSRYGIELLLYKDLEFTNLKVKNIPLLSEEYKLIFLNTRSSKQNNLAKSEEFQDQWSIHSLKDISGYSD